MSDLGFATSELANGPLLGSHKGRMEGLLRHFHKIGLPLAVCADRKHMNRKAVTLKVYARRLKLAFPDYVPLALRPPKPSKAKQRKRQ